MYLNERGKLVVNKFEIIWCDLGITIGSIQGGLRPCVVVSNNKCNFFSPVIHVAPITSVMTKATMPTHIEVVHIGLDKDSIILVEQTTSIDKKQIKSSVGNLDLATIKRLKNALKIQIDLVDELEPINYRYIDEVIRDIMESKRRYLEYKDEYFLRIYKTTMKTLEIYCIKYKKDYKELAKERIQLSRSVKVV
ncbi:type II toxin-antitoxin system PemK/MazF family toxin [Clostridium tagluense]|uniref:Type II toxin-antitoxin system PemK/MazF family toxin n=1 Tax=Clostridium tagluense TaxID=360422 RepID=A0A401UTN2_9CLOT|nr:type II toxin-antitoxin system PemK/MazF family toxin [Clostridium tagluense]GCD12874.1 hypothetical protein Ctaglu_44970 [Clostridium tagluense]